MLNIHSVPLLRVISSRHSGRFLYGNSFFPVVFYYKAKNVVVFVVTHFFSACMLFFLQNVIFKINLRSSKRCSALESVMHFQKSSIRECKWKICQKTIFFVTFSFNVFLESDPDKKYSEHTSLPNFFRGVLGKFLARLRRAKKGVPKFFACAGLFFVVEALKTAKKR